MGGVETAKTGTPKSPCLQSDLPVIKGHIWDHGRLPYHRDAEGGKEEGGVGDDTSLNRPY